MTAMWKFTMQHTICSRCYSYLNYSHQQGLHWSVHQSYLPFWGILGLARTSPQTTVLSLLSPCKPCHNYWILWNGNWLSDVSVAHQVFWWKLQWSILWWSLFVVIFVGVWFQDEWNTEYPATSKPFASWLHSTWSVMHIIIPRSTVSSAYRIATA